MATTAAETPAPPQPVRRSRIQFSAAIYEPGRAKPAWQNAYRTRQERRDGTIGILLDLYTPARLKLATEVQVTSVLTTFGGANPDWALRAALDVMPCRDDVELALDDFAADAGPECFYGVVVDYGDDGRLPAVEQIPVSTTLYPTAEARLAGLHERAQSFTEYDLPRDLTAEEAVRVIEVGLFPTRGTVRLFTVRREAETPTEIYRSELV